MNSSHYSRLLLPHPLSINENQMEYLSITERHIQVVWLEQIHFDGLRTSEGIPINVISPGIWNAQSGPDFKRAHLKVGDREIRGDVEIHLSDESWYSHRHHTDSRYDDVVLHLSLWQPKRWRPITNSLNAPIIQAHLETFLNVPLERVVKMIDLDLYPYHQHCGTGKCSDLLFSKIPIEEVFAFFKGAAAWRLIKKSEKIHQLSRDPGESLIGSICTVLGYKNNGSAFQSIFRHLRGFQEVMGQSNEKELFAAALGLSGFFSEDYQKKWGECPYFTELRDIFHQMADCPEERRISLSLDRIRPFNHPIRRLAYLVKFLLDPRSIFLYDSLLDTWGSLWTQARGGQGNRHIRAGLEKLVPIYEDPYWNSHYTFSVSPSEKFLPLAGKHLTQLILTNCFFPMLIEDILRRDSIEEQNCFWDLFCGASQEETGKSRYLQSRFFGNSKKGSLLRSGMIEQGAYQLHSDFCTHYEASCEGCPFVNRYKQY